MSCISYEQWLLLGEAERDAIHLNQWDFNARDGYTIAITAASRLAASCQAKVHHIEIGTYHGPEYLLHLYVRDEDCVRMPSMLEQRFEGFRVVWFPLSRLMVRPTEHGTISGNWRHEGDDTDVEFRFDASTSPPRVSARCISDGEELVISQIVGNDKFLIFCSTMPSNGYGARHCFHLTGRNLCSQEITMQDTWVRSSPQ